jgi:uncharacterized OB-fold protein
MAAEPLHDRCETSPTETYLDYCRRGELAYQVCEDDGRAVFYPRLFAPGTGSPRLEWRVSKGLGSVYATTVIYRRNEAPYNVSMIELDEGFRMMSRVEDIDPDQVEIGLRVKMRMYPGNEKNPPYPVFVPAERAQ